MIVTVIVMVVSGSSIGSKGESQKTSLNVHELHEKNQSQRVHYDTTTGAETMIIKKETHTDDDEPAMLMR